MYIHSEIYISALPIPSSRWFPNRPNRKGGTDLALISNETQDDIIALVVFGFTLAIIMGVLGYVMGMMKRFRPTPTPKRRKKDDVVKFFEHIGKELAKDPRPVAEPEPLEDYVPVDVPDQDECTHCRVEKVPNDQVAMPWRLCEKCMSEPKHGFKNGSLMRRAAFVNELENQPVDDQINQRWGWE